MNRLALRGFTLLELMVALGIFALIGAASYTMLSSETRSQQRLQEASARLSHWQRGMLRLSQDILQIAPRAIREDYGSREYMLVGDSSSLTFTRNGWSNPLQRQRSDLQRVHYEVLSGEESSALQRSFWSTLDRAPGSEPLQQIVIPDVESLSVRYLDPENGEWREQWPPQSGIGEDSSFDKLPEAIEIILTSSHLGEIRRLLPLGLQRQQP